MTPDDGGSEGPKVFLSYAHDDADHVAAVLELSRLLETSGVAVEFDLWRADSRQDWYAWALREIQAADFVIVVASPMYRAVGDGSADGDEHRGVQAEAAALRELLYRDRRTWLRKVLPVILPGRSVDDLPEFVQPVTASHFIIETITDEGADGLLRVLTGQPRHVRPSRGKIPVLPPRPGFLSAMAKKLRRPTVNTRRASALAAMLVLTASVLALPIGKARPYDVNAENARETPDDAGAHAAGGTTTTDPSREQPSAGAALPGPTGSPGTGDQSQRAPAPDGDEWGAPVMPEGAPTGGMPSHQGVLDVMAVDHSFAGDVDRISVTVRNTNPDDELVRQIDVFMDDLSGHEWGDSGSWWFVISEDMAAGAPAYDGSSRVHGTIRMSGSEFSQPLVGRGYIDDRGSWRRLLTFTPQKFLAGTESVTIVIDVPLTHLLQSIRADQTAGPVTEQTLDPQRGAVFTRVDIWTPDDHSFACDYLRRPEDKPVCDQVDPAAAVGLPG